MKVYYDKETDSAYIELSQTKPSGTIEISEGVNIDTTNAGEVVGIELLNASARFPIDTLFKFEVEPSLT